MNLHKEKPFTKEEFDAIYSRVPRLCVEVIVRNQEGIWLTKRSIEPAKGLWHIPGGTVYIKERLADAVRRIAYEELGITQLESDPELLGVIEYNFPEYKGYPIGIAYEVQTIQIPKQGRDAEEIKAFDILPKDMIPEQRNFLTKQYNM
jgi:ADP-ribose pyrophosphatase YjhB (NUDIX family)